MPQKDMREGKRYSLTFTLGKGNPRPHLSSFRHSTNPKRQCLSSSGHESYRENKGRTKRLSKKAKGSSINFHENIHQGVTHTPQISTHTFTCIHPYLSTFKSNWNTGTNGIILKPEIKSSRKHFWTSVTVHVARYFMFPPFQLPHHDGL